MSSTTRTCVHHQQAVIPHRLAAVPNFSPPATQCEPGLPPTDAHPASLAAVSPLSLRNVDLVESGGSAVSSRDHEPVGTVEQIFAGLDTRVPEWFTVATSRGEDASVLVPLAGCGTPAPDGYDPGLRYPLRADPLVLSTPPENPARGPEPGRLNDWFASLPA